MKFSIYLNKRIFVMFCSYSLFVRRWFQTWCWFCHCISSLLLLVTREGCASWLRHFLGLRKHAYSNILNISPPKNESFQTKILIFFRIFDQNIDCGYSFEPPRRGGSNEYPQSLFLSRNEKKNVYPYKSQFCYIKVGFKGTKIICFRDGYLHFIHASNIFLYVTSLFLIPTILNKAWINSNLCSKGTRDFSSAVILS